MSNQHMSMNNRFEVTGSPVYNPVAPKPERIGRKAFDTLMSLLAEDPETPVTAHGIFIANSTKRKLKKQIEGLFLP